MTIEEAIIHAKEVAENKDDMCAECRAEHQQLAEWLEELKSIKSKRMDEKLDVIYNAINDYLEASKIIKMDDIFEVKYKIFDVLLDCLAVYSQENLEDE